MTYQQITIVGHAGKDAVMRYTPNGSATATFSVATNERHYDNEGNVTIDTTWFTVTCYKSAAEYACKHIKKGNLVMAVGKLTSDQGGNPRVFEYQGEHRANYEMIAFLVRNFTWDNNGNDYDEEVF